MSKEKQAGRSVRLLRVGELVRHAISECLSRGMVHDPALAGVSITVTGADVSPDLRNATIHVHPLGGTLGDKTREEVLDGLNRSAGFLRGQLGKSVAMKYVPKLKFQMDVSFDEAGKINALLSQSHVLRDLGGEEK